MPRYIALLRGINVGGHRLKMDDLRRIFTVLKFAKIETFIASGNVIFDAVEREALGLETRIEGQLRRSLGYEADTFIRTPSEIAAITDFRPFSLADMDAGDHSINVVFLRAAQRMALRSHGAGARRTPRRFLRVPDSRRLPRAVLPAVIAAPLPPRIRTWNGDAGRTVATASTRQSAGAEARTAQSGDD